MLRRIMTRTTQQDREAVRQVALSGGGLAAFVVAGFLFSTLVGFIVLGVALLAADYSLDTKS